MTVTLSWTAAGTASNLSSYSATSKKKKKGADLETALTNTYDKARDYLDMLNKSIHIQQKTF